ncbi:cytochrome b/b6 domain-containing protein [Mucilaginibacter sp. E4BP6]|jgi:Ni,Fe-hydrogenase I cytochrome b subunit|uniref:cytochrome b/b6 domain-containing protein n=1 Tax=Mucilaginibacter sp. E4BP6 TaxID=2723089 RepID=UPI0015C76A32|nr:cytochrome b/b6 domain-containing protein [Mucilaginibacter sp. E4BP6]NYE68196.1 Ni,Fe-hydrogenase I cytochrome b subunit [Mucilaginibacter sp. E4BP6]
MTIIEPNRRDVQHPQEIKKHSSSIRLWHWLNAIVITGSLLTVLLNSTLLKTKKNAVSIKANLASSGVTVTDGQARSVAHELSDKVWMLHTYFGYTLAALLLFRLLLEFFQQVDQKFIRKLKSAYHQYQTTKKQRELAKHEFWVKTIYAIFYLMLITMAITGLCLAFEDDVPLLKSIHAFRQIHAFTMYLILAFIVIHIAGVFLAERKDSQGIVSDMINGGKES